MKKLFTIVAVALAAVAFTAPATKAEAKVISVEKAAKKIAKAEAKAYKTKKVVNVKVQIKVKKKKVYKTMQQLGEKVTNIEADCKNVNDQRDASRFSYDYESLDSYFLGEEKTTGSYKYSNGVATLKINIKGSNKQFRTNYYENMCLKDNIADLNEYLKDAKKEADGKEFNEYDKAWAVMGWCSTIGRYYGSGRATMDSDIKKGNFYGVCEDLANFYSSYAHYVGVKAGVVQTDFEDGGHVSNCVMIDGQVYFLDFQEYWDYDNEYDALVEYETKVDEIKITSYLYKLIHSEDFRGWPSEVTRGEYCLLTQEQWYAHGDFDAKPSKWKYWGLD